ncbi:unnamed protein product [Calicophoron daubneyi]|uniref:Malate dehydrogenase n=1 Tax=Calicophoron daubneyi TaxID=300641 RepID=A0AAV2TRJ4_CALDB
MGLLTPREYTRIVARHEVAKFCLRCMEKVGVPREHARHLGDVLTAGDYRGHYSHGLNRLEMYVMDVEKKVCDVHKKPVVVKETCSTALINGNNLLGPTVGIFSMQTAIKKAKETGVSWIATYGSNHFGIAGYYSMLAAKEGLIGLAFTNTSPLVFPTRAKKQVLGTNPMTIAAPGSKPEDDFVLDMATSTVAVGKLEMCRRRNLSIPSGWAGDDDGKPTADPAVAIDKGGLFPLGGEEITSGYKGYGLSVMVEILCGILANAAYGPGVRKWMITTHPANLGQCFAAIDPQAFAPGFHKRMSDFMKTLRGLPRVDPELPVLVAGDPEREHIAECEKLGGIRYPPVLIESVNRLAERLNVDPLPVLRDL